MKILLSCCLFFVTLFSYCEVSAQAKKSVNIIYDTDIDLDVDDVGALAILHAFADNGEAAILGVICNSPTPYAATTVSAINLYYGRPELPVGDMPMDEYVYDTAFSKRYRNYQVETPFGNFNLPIFKRFPRTIQSRKDVWNGVALYRKLLAEAEDTSVTIAAVGLLTVLEDLLQSGGDKWSKLSGRELIKKKVKHLVCMAGARQPRPGKWDFNWGFEGRGDAERISRTWPTPLVIMPLGSKIQTGERLTAETLATNPVRAAYELFLAPQDFKNRSSWDQLAVYYAVRGAENLFTEDNTKRLDITNDPLTYTWRERKPGEPYHMLLGQKASDETFEKIIDDLMVQAPKKGGMKTTAKVAQ